MIEIAFLMTDTSSEASFLPLDPAPHLDSDAEADGADTAARYCRPMAWI